MELKKLNLSQVRAGRFEVAVLPLGATEPHNLHLPYGTDIHEGTTIGRQICSAANAAGARVVLLPTIPFGTETNLQQFPLAINLNPSTLALVIRDIVQSLENSGIRKLVLLNSHGGNDLKPVLRELHLLTSVKIFLCNWYLAIADLASGLFEHPDDHAGEMETSFMLAWHPELVARNPDGTLAADAGEKRASRFDAVNRGWVGVSRPWHLLTTQSGAGNPHSATADKGHRLMDHLVQRLSPFLVELSASEIDGTFPF